MEEELSSPIGVEGTGEEIALSEMAAKFAEAVDLQIGLNTLGDCAKIQTAGKFED